MGLIQLKDIFWVDTPLGSGHAILVETNDHDTYWTVALENGALVTFTQDRIRMTRCYTHRRGISDEEMLGLIKKVKK